MSDSCVNVVEEGRVTTVEFCDAYLLEQAHIAQVQDALYALVTDRERPLVLIDFYKVEGVSSAMLGTLLSVHKRIKEKNGRLRLTNVDPKLMKIFTLTNLHKVIKFAASRTEGRSMLTGVAWNGEKV